MKLKITVFLALFAASLCAGESEELIEAKVAIYCTYLESWKDYKYDYIWFIDESEEVKTRINKKLPKLRISDPKLSKKEDQTGSIIDAKTGNQGAQMGTEIKRKDNEGYRIELYWYSGPKGLETYYIEVRIKEGRILIPDHKDWERGIFAIDNRIGTTRHLCGISSHSTALSHMLY